MAVTIDDMQVDVQDQAPETQSSSGTAEPKKPLNLRRDLQMLAERELRLKAN
jgi:hypothetical protein